MKRCRLFIALLLTQVMAFSLVSCGDDDEPGNVGPSGNATGRGTITISDGKTVTYDHGYFYVETSGTPRSIEFVFSDCDRVGIMETRPDALYNDLMFSVNSEGNTVPEGTFAYGTWNFLEIYDFNMSKEEEDGTYFYGDDENRGYESGNMVITRSGNGYRIEVKDLKLLRSSDGEAISSSDPKVTATFVWEGEIADITDWMNE